MTAMNKGRDCAEIDRALDRGLNDVRGSLSECAQAHLAGCPRCSALIGTLEEPDYLPDTSLPLAQIQSTLLSDLRPVRPLLPAPVYFAAIVLTFAIAVAVGGQALGFLAWQTLTTVQRLVTLTSLAASATLLALAMVTQMTPGSRYRIAPWSVAPAALVLLLVTVAGMFRNESDPQFVRVGVPCLIAGISVAIPAAVLLFFITRRGLMLHPLIFGATCGMLAGVTGTSALEVHCPILDLRHVLVWHLSVCLAGALTGSLAGWAGSRVKPLP